MVSTPTPASGTMLIASALSSAALALKAYEDELANGKPCSAVADSLRATIAALKRSAECLALAVAGSVGYVGPMAKGKRRHPRHLRRRAPRWRASWRPTQAAREARRGSTESPSLKRRALCGEQSRRRDCGRVAHFGALRAASSATTPATADEAPKASRNGTAKPSTRPYRRVLAVRLARNLWYICDSLTPARRAAAGTDSARQRSRCV